MSLGPQGCCQALAQGPRCGYGALLALLRSAGAALRPPQTSFWPSRTLLEAKGVALLEAKGVALLGPRALAWCLERALAWCLERALAWCLERARQGE